MPRVFITGSADGLGLMAAKLLIEQGHQVILHGRNDSRSRDALAAAAGAEGVVTGDLSTIAGTRAVADAVNKLGPFDSVIHNAGVGYRESRRLETEPGVPRVFAVNVLAPYILTALIETPKRLVYLSLGRSAPGVCNPGVACDERRRTGAIDDARYCHETSANQRLPMREHTLRDHRSPTVGLCVSLPGLPTAH